MTTPPRSPAPVLAGALVLAFLLHMPAHVGFRGGSAGGPAGRGPLYEDGPAFLANPAYERRGAEGFADVARRAAVDPAAAWGEGGVAVASSRWTPASSVLLAAQRSAFGSRAAVAAGVLSLLLHLAVVALSVSLLARLAVPRAAQFVAAALVAASPAALPAAAWPARQGVVLAAALGLSGVHLVLRGGLARGAAGGILVALAGLAHPAAFGLAPAAAFLRRPGGAGTPARRALAAAGPMIPAALAAIAVLFRLSAAARDLPPAHPPASAGRPPGFLDGAVGILQAIVSAALPARMHFADGPWAAGILGHAAAVVLVAVLASRAMKARAQASGSEPFAAAPSLLLAALAALSPLLLVGVAGGSPYHEGPLYVATPFLAGAAGCAVAWGVARGGSLRPAAAAAGALLVGATVAGAAVRAPAFRTREGLLALGLREMPASPVVRAWDLDAAVVAAKGDGRVAPEEIAALADRAVALARRAVDVESVPVRSDPVAAASIATALSRFAAAVAESGTPPGEEVWDAAADAARAATDVAPWSSQTFLVLAVACEGQGALLDAYDAAGAALDLAPDDVPTRAAAVRAALGVARVGLAAFSADRMLELEQARVKREGGRTDPQVLLLYARAMAADGTMRAPDALGGRVIRFRFEAAIAALLSIADVEETRAEARRLLHDVYLHYGDVLASLDRTALATLAYREAVALGGEGGEAAEHAGWLAKRLRAEEAAAHARVEEASRGVGNLADALVSLAVALSRQGRFDEAKAVFDKLEHDLGMSPALRYHRAVHFLREQDRARAIDDLRRAVSEDPSLARASYELGLLLEESGDFEGAVRAFDEAVRRSNEAAATTGVEEWAIDATRRLEDLNRLLLEEGER